LKLKEGWTGAREGDQGTKPAARTPRQQAKLRGARFRAKTAHAIDSLSRFSIFRGSLTQGESYSFSELESSVPNIASAKKNMRKSRAAQARNRAQRSALRTALKKAKAEGASAEVRGVATTLLDRAARKGLIHKNAAARQKSRMAKRVNAAAAA
jgi:small subunit ribosomal protein S20